MKKISHLEKATENKAGIPLYREASSGNMQYAQSFTEIEKHIKSLKVRPIRILT